ncbi:MAG: hypothetical protein KGI97_02545 [Alphaproteobacteria bacterium]|nr:hypothetical protein [Alphaproteobacteria bacterium]
MKIRSFLILAAGLFAVSALSLAPCRAFADEGASKPVAGKKKEDDVTGGRFAGDPIYVHLAPLVMPVIDGNGAEQLVTIMIDVQVKDFDAADNMHTNMPRVMDALMTHLYGGLGSGSLRNGKLVNVDKVKRRATAAVASVIGAENVVDVLVQGVAQRML